MSDNIHGENLKATLITAQTTISQAVKHMDSEAALVTDPQGRLIGLITDGDIRRAFLAGAALNTPVNEIMTHKPVTVPEKTPPMAITALMMQRKIRHLPVIDKNGRPVALELLKHKLEDLEPAGAIVMAGGKGTRLRPLTLNTPKPLLKIGEQTILDNILQNLQQNGVKDIVLTVNYMAEQIQQHIGNGSKHKVSVNYVQEEQELGTAGGLTLLGNKPTSSFLVMNGDLLTELDYRSLINFHRNNNSMMTVCVRRHKIQIPYGVVDMAENQLNINNITEKPQHEFLVNAGIYMLEPEVLQLIPKGKPFDMVSLMNTVSKNNWDVAAFPILEYWKDIGQHEEIKEARLYCQNKIDSQNTSSTVPADILIQGAS